MNKTRTEYESVGGDIGLVRIDGRVLPFRHDSVLRGEDVCFLIEAYRDRLLLVQGKAPDRPVDKYHFTRRISAEQMNDLVSMYRGLSPNDLFYPFVKEAGLVEREITSAQANNPLEIDGLRQDAVELNVRNVSAGDIVRSHDLQKMFDVLKLFNSGAHHTPIQQQRTWNTERSGTAEGVSINYPDTFRYHYLHYWGEFVDDYRLWASPAEITFDWYGSGYENFSAKSVSVLCTAFLNANRTVDGVSVFSRQKYFLLKIADIELQKGATSYTVGISDFSHRAEAIIRDLLGFVPQKGESQGEGHSVSENSAVSIVNFLVVKNLRDNTRWWEEPST